jgi:hypothetical protein
MTDGDLAAFSAFLDATIRERLSRMTREQLEDELLLMHRTIKAVEELGEVVGALIGLTGANPRKGVTHTAADLVAELHDVAVSVEGAAEHVLGNTGLALDGLEAKAAYVHQRAGLPMVHSSIGSFSRADCRCEIGRDHAMEDGA